MASIPPSDLVERFVDMLHAQIKRGVGLDAAVADLERFFPENGQRAALRAAAEELRRRAASIEHLRHPTTLRAGGRAQWYAGPRDTDDLWPLKGTAGHEEVGPSWSSPSTGEPGFFVPRLSGQSDFRNQGSCSGISPEWKDRQFHGDDQQGSGCRVPRVSRAVGSDQLTAAADAGASHKRARDGGTDPMAHLDRRGQGHRRLPFQPRRDAGGHRLTSPRCRKEERAASAPAAAHAARSRSAPAPVLSGSDHR